MRSLMIIIVGTMLLGLVCIFSITSGSNELEKQREDFLKSDLNDPSSYGGISAEIPDTMFTSDDALEMLTKEKQKLDLGLITQEEYNKKKKEISKFIK